MHNIPISSIRALARLVEAEDKQFLLDSLAKLGRFSG